MGGCYRGWTALYLFGYDGREGGGWNGGGEGVHPNNLRDLNSSGKKDCKIVFGRENSCLYLNYKFKHSLFLFNIKHSLFPAAKLELIYFSSNIQNAEKFKHSK